MRKCILLLLLSFGVGKFHAQTTQMMSLEQAVQYAIQNSPEVKISQNSILDADQQIKERKAIGLPRLDAEVSYNYFAIIPTTFLPESFGFDPATGMTRPGFDRSAQFGVKNNLTGGLSLSALIFDGSYIVGLRAARLYKEYVNQDLFAKRKAVANKAKMAYLPALLINTGLQTIDKNIINLQKLLTEITAVQKAGLAEELDVDRIQLSLSNLQTERDNLNRQREIAINYLKFVISFPIDEFLEVSDDLNTLSGNLTGEDLTSSINYQNRSEYGVIEKGQQLNELNVKLYQAGYLPSIVGFANYQYSIIGDKLSGPNSVGAPTSIIGGKMSIPIFDGFEKKAKLQRAKIQLLNALENKKMFERGVDLETNNARKSYLSATEKLKAQKSNLALAEKIYKTTQEKYKQGVGSSLEITTGEQSLYTTQQNVNQAIYDLVVARIALENALGK